MADDKLFIVLSLSYIFMPLDKKKIKLFSHLSRIMEAMGCYVKTYGQVEQDKDFYRFQTALLNDPNMVYEILDKISERKPKIGYELSALLLQFGTINQRMKNLQYMPPEEKVKVGNELIKLSKRLTKIKEMITIEASKKKKGS